MEEMELLMRRLAVIRRIAESIPGCGKTSIQKIVYFLQTARGLPLGYRFKMHHYGPYSEKLDGNLSLADAMGLVEVNANSGGYGFHVEAGQYQIDPTEHGIPWEKVDKMIHALGAFQLWQLELMATVHFVRSIQREATESEIVETVSRLKPYFEHADMEQAYAHVYDPQLIGMELGETMP